MKYLLALLCLLVIGGTFFSYSVSAQKESKNGKVSLADQMGRLADSIDKLLEKSSNTNATPETNIIDQNKEDFH